MFEQMGAHIEALDQRVQLLERRQEIADEDDLRMARQRLEARQAGAGFTGTLAEAMQSTKRRQIVGQRYGDRIKTFEDWKTAQ